MSLTASRIGIVSHVARTGRARKEGYMTQTTDRTEGAHPVDYERLRYAMGMVPNLGKCNAEVRGWALDTLCPVPGKGPVRLGEMTRDDHKMVATYLKAHDSMYPGEHRAE